MNRPVAWTYERFDGWDGAWDAARRRQAPVRVTIYNHLDERWIYAVVHPNGDVERHAEPKMPERTGVKRNPDPARPCRWIVEDDAA